MASCTAVVTADAVCDASNLGRRVHVDTNPGNPGLDFRAVAAGSSAVGVTIGGGQGHLSSLSADARTLTWTGRSTCTNPATALVTLEHVWECQRAP